MRFFRVLAICSLIAPGLISAQDFVTFESIQHRPLAISPNGLRLAVVNTPDNSLELFDVDNLGLVHAGSVPVGLEPVAVEFRDDGEVWVVNHLSDSVSVVSLGGAVPRVTRTLLVGDEPRDIVFAGQGANRAFISAAHRGQNSPYTDPNDPGELTTAGTGRTDVWIFNANNLGAGLGGDPLSVVTMFGSQHYLAHIVR